MPLSEKPRKHYKPIEPNPPDPVTGKEFGLLTEEQAEVAIGWMRDLHQTLYPALRTLLEEQGDANLLKLLSPGLSWAKYYEKPLDQVVIDLARVMGQTSAVYLAGLSADPQQSITDHTKTILGQMDQQDKQAAFVSPIQIEPQNVPEFVALFLVVIHNIISHMFLDAKPIHDRILEVRNHDDLPKAKKAALMILHIDPTAIACPSIAHLHQLAILKRDESFLNSLASAQTKSKAPSVNRNLYFTLSLLNEAGSPKPSPKRLYQLMVDRFEVYTDAPDAPRLINEKALKIMKKRTSVHV